MQYPFSKMEKTKNSKCDSLKITQRGIFKKTKNKAWSDSVSQESEDRSR